MSKYKQILVILLLLNLPKIVFASFVGNVMEAHVYVPPSAFFGPGGTFSSKTFEVDESIEVPLFGILNESSIDVSQNNIFIDFWRSGTTYSDLEYYVFEDINSTISDITGVTINIATTDFYTSWGAPVAFEQSRINFDENMISIDLSGLGARETSQLSLDVTFSPVPLPATIWLFSAGILLLFAFTRKNIRV